MSEPTAKKWGRTEPRDGFLEIILGVAERGGPLDVSLFVNGLIISGTVTSRDDYYKSFAGGGLHEALEMQEHTDESPSDKAESGSNGDAEQEEPDTIYRFIHLKDAQIFVPGQHPMPAGPGLRWRGRISSIDGYSEGRLVVAE